MKKRFQTVGQLFQSVAKAELDQKTSRAESVHDKLEDMDDDVFTINNDQDKSYPTQIKTEVKEEYNYTKDEQDDVPVLKSRQVTQFLVLHEPENAKPLRIKLDFIEPPLKKKNPQFHFEKFRHEDVWDPARQLRCKINSDKICIANMVELPPQKHVLNRPKPYKPIQPLKKKMYRPAVPRMFKSGYDQFLSRRQNNKKGGEIDLGVLHLDQVLDECYNRNLIPLITYNQFINTNGHLQIRQFLEKWVKGQLHEFNFKKTYFTLLDHRRLSEILIHCYPNSYTLGSIQALHADVKEFISKIYYLSNDDYVQAYLLQDEISETTWWHELRIRFENNENNENSHYFIVKQSISKPPLPTDLQYDKQRKSEYLRELVGNFKLQDSQKELEKILSMKYKHIQKAGFHPDEGTSSYGRNDEDEQQLQESHDPQSEMSFNQPSIRGQKSGTGPDWSKLFHDDKQSDLYEED